ncbi:alkanesulfonate transporter substrate-binding subunit [Geobacter sp. OR-1]|uniref:ABC transporter substrate-binding protein n=1 Tax=Geobacter sp. OR-1 TaxID=1266765 RepID=UPI0005423D1A|nr:ABC transporter substrate-binding protein [Geobacter sp. OR-1]GAM10280.1 alkanesulfonate transporter substrate-binding subunit [Geobacter sp. OR-1]
MSNKIKILTIAIIVVAIAGAGWFFTKKSQATTGDVAIRVFETTSPNQWELVKKLTGRDILAEEGVMLAPVPSVAGGSGGTTALQALLAKNVDTAGSAWPAWINIVASGGRIKALLGTTVSTKDNKSGTSGLLVLEESSIRTIKDLAGKRIAVNVLGAEADYVIRQYLKKNGLAISQVQLVVVPSENQEQMLRSRQVDAVAWTSNGGSYFDMTVERGGVREIPGTRNYETKGEAILFGIGFHNDFIEKHPDTVRRYIKAYDTARRIIFAEYKKDPELVKRVYGEISAEKGSNPRLAKYYQATSWTPDFPLIVEKDLQWWIDRFIEDGLLKPGQVKPTDIFTNEFNPLSKK